VHVLARYVHACRISARRRAREGKLCGGGTTEHRAITTRESTACIHTAAAPIGSKQSAISRNGVTTVHKLADGTCST